MAGAGDLYYAEPSCEEFQRPNPLDNLIFGQYFSSEVYFNLQCGRDAHGRLILHVPLPVVAAFYGKKHGPVDA